MDLFSILLEDQASVPQTFPGGKPSQDRLQGFSLLPRQIDEGEPALVSKRPVARRTLSRADHDASDDVNRKDEPADCRGEL
jgi:hypothetical protein